MTTRGRPKGWKPKKRTVPAACLKKLALAREKKREMTQIMKDTKAKPNCALPVHSQCRLVHAVAAVQCLQVSSSRGPSGPPATQARLLPQHLEPTATRCPSQHARRRLKSLSQAMPQRRDSCTALAIRYSRSRLYCVAFF